MTQQADQLAINTIRTLSIDAIEKANSGHPGLPMGAAPMAYTLWTKQLRHNPSNPKWFNRDRFILSAGHGSMLLYSLLHLGGYDLPMEEIKSFRQWDSKTPGHPEYGHTAGVEATTGPLGQGIAMAVGMAMAESHLAGVYNKPEHEVVDHYTFALCGDGDLMEGVAAEAISLAGHLQLEKLIVLYDSNDISLDGDLNKSFSENIQKRFGSYNWNYIHVADGNDIEAINTAIEQAKAHKGQPTIIEVKTVIGYGSPNKSGKADSHGSPLGADEVKLTKEHYSWPHDPFHVPEEVYATFKQAAEVQGTLAEATWNEQFEAYKKAYPDLAEQFVNAMNGELPENFASAVPVYESGKSIATRSSSGEVINALAKNTPSFFGGSADLAGSNKTYMKDAGDFTAETPEGRNIWFGVREFAMGAALNGMALHGGVNVFGGTFFVFSDYVRPAIRLSALMGLPVTYVFTHDSIAVGEDGPTHEPVEHLAALRSMPNLSVIRPADANESAEAWKLAVSSKNQPTVLVLSRQNLPVSEHSASLAAEGVSKGAYVVSKATKEVADALILATGSEVSLAIEAQKQLAAEGIDVSVVSMPSFDRFEAQDAAYKEAVLPKTITKRLAIEMGSSFGWHKYTGFEGDVLAIDKFGASAPGEIVMKEYGFTVENVVSKVKALFA
ncbi:MULTISPECIES: transketolase [unclassified Viridibacillus]|uniref:transketolase n=1 Tax=unclassified Viridibacillus TaxID=2617942 RepID=UPI00096D5F1A|nr:MULTISPECIES: transketolase [unclassified Viridibacillus]OMC84181.1 transketolase [Viridibacillus sp. FSL H8-0123]OMC88702.1 transketolase [Viridibacillus sp. FSL H7-0596]